MTNPYEDLTTEALELLETRKALPTKFREQLTEQGAKFCTSCQTVQELEQFRISATSKSGRAGKCFTCHPEQVKISQRDFSVDKTEFTVARSLARLRRQSRKNGYPVEAFGVTELLEHWGNPPRSEIGALQLIDPARGFTITNIAPSTVQNEENNTND